jgi:hypothetical protein
MTKSKVDHCVETICSRGCRTVYRVLESLQKGRAVDALDGLSSRERAAVRAELEAVMAVYKSNAGSGCST